MRTRTPPETVTFTCTECSTEITVQKPWECPSKCQERRCNGDMLTTTPPQPGLVKYGTTGER